MLKKIMMMTRRRYDDNEEDEAYVHDVEGDNEEIEDDYKEENDDDKENASLTRNKRTTITNNMVTMTREMTMKLEDTREEITTKELARKRERTMTNYIKQTKYYNKEEKGVVVEGTEITADGDEEDEEETS